MDLLSQISLGLDVALQPVNLLYCFVGVAVGTVIGVIPGVGTLAAMSMLFPLSFLLEPTTGLIMLAGIWYGTTYGGSTTSILLNIPGTPANAVTALDGYPMARQGRGGIALLMTTVASFFGATFGILLVMLFSPAIAVYALEFGPTEYFALMVLGLVAASSISGGSVAKGLAMVTLGIMLGCVGIDLNAGTPRFTFGQPELMDGVSLIALAMAIFGVSEVIMTVRRVKPTDIDPETVRLEAMLPSRDDLRRSWFPMLRGSSVGSFFGTLPGTGPAIAAFVAYAIERRIAREPDRFGKGAIEGIMAPETANNAADQTAFIPTLALGIPGSATMALLLGALMIHGIVPGPTLMQDRPELVWGLIMSFWVGNLMLLVLNIPFIGLWVRLLTVPYRLLYPVVLMFICIGVFSYANSAFDVWQLMVLGVMGYAMRVFAFPAAPMLLGFVLGPMMEEHFRRAMILSRGDLMTFVERPISGTIIAVTLLILLASGWSALRRWRRARAA
ncbi:tripartite tricarboxylate transporter permease [Pararhodobacter marinus]|uniref:tripartite tricarboxylate transporter permease n=1 Tax=Pararhodobacter marinus TaxID=2184063 RepID=UPI003519704E